MLIAAKSCCGAVSAASEKQRNDALYAMARRLIEHKDDILAENAADVAAASDHLSASMIDRLTLSESRIKDMAKGITDVAGLDDPVGRLLESRTLRNGLYLEKRSVSIGLISIIYESRPNVTSDAAALCIKSGNCCLLRTGRDAIRSSCAIVSALREGLADVGLPKDSICLVRDTDHKSANEIMTAVGIVDLLIPRGGASLINSCVQNAKVPVLRTGTGICHIYVDKDADFEKALNIIENAKAQRPSVCNAAEVCLVHSGIAADFLPLLKERLTDMRAARGLTPVELRLDGRCAKIINGKPACERDFDTEFLDYILAVGLVDSAQDAVRHIAAHSTGHSEAIITENGETADFFINSVDSAAVYVNASTRFTDGGQFGLGCEMGISTQKLHARGPVGLCELTSYKYIIRGNGQTRQ